MDVESFNQCLIYMQSVAPNKSLIEKFLPAIGGVSGAVLGFLLTSMVAFSKERKVLANKLMCCNEDVARVQSSVEQLIKELFKILMCISVGDLPKGHGLPTNIGALCLSEYFKDVAHKFSKNQRYLIQATLENTSEINSLIDVLQRSSSLEDKYKYSLGLLSAIGLALQISNGCKNIIGNTNKEQLDQIEELERIGVSSSEIKAFLLLKSNASNQNDILKLK
ncbi:hypothetical protein [Pseudomonas sp. SDO52101_S400]